MFIVRDERRSSKRVEQGRSQNKIVAEAMSMVKFVYDDY